MQIRSTISQPQRPKAAPKKPVKENFGEGIPGYTGPADGLSNPRHQWLTRPLNKALIAGCFRMEVEGEENFPHEGAQVYCPTHPSMFDPPLIAALSDRDMRYPANVYVFDGIRGKMMEWGGAFPLHRDKPKMRTLRHMVDVVNQGKGFVIFPEGGIASEQEQGQVGPLKKGAARIAILGGAEAITPIATDYRPNTKKRTGETIKGAIAATAVAAGGVLSAFGGPVTRAVGGAISGALTGAYISGKVNRNITSNPEWFDPFPKYFATINGGLLGAGIGAVTGALTTTFMPGGAAPLVAASLGVGAGLGTWSIAKGLRDRDIAHVKIGKPIPVAPYMEKYNGDTRKAGDALTLDLHRALSKEKQALNGISQPEPSFRGVVEESLKLKEGEEAPPPLVTGPNKFKAALKYGSIPAAGGGLGTLIGLGAASLFGLDPAISGAAGLVAGVATGSIGTIQKAVKSVALPPELR